MGHALQLSVAGRVPAAAPAVSQHARFSRGVHRHAAGRDLVLRPQSDRKIHAEVLNGDKAAVRLDGAPTVHGVPFSGTSGICRNVSMPLRCIVLLSQAPENRIRRLGASEALALLPQNAFADASVREEWQRTLSLLLDLIAAVPVYALACTPDVRAVETLEHALVRDGF